MSDVESVTAIKTRVEERIDTHQRRMESVTAALGTPRTAYWIAFSVIVWICLNVGLSALGVTWLDPAPFYGLHLASSIAGLAMAVLILITQNRESRDDRERSHLTLQVNLLAEQKVTKLISLLEELRHDLPNVRDRVDREAEEMLAPVDPQAVLDALQEAPATTPPEET
jgi:uncharacterized membrane protein